MIRLLALAALAIITSSAPAAVLGEEGAPARLARRGGVVDAALAQPQSDRADSTPASCPYDFGSDMPAATFCVYQGVAFGDGGEVCATDVVVIWSSLASQATVHVGRADKASAAREVYLGFVTDPGLVVRAIVDPRQGDHADMVGYTLGREAAPQPLAGQTTLRAVRPGSAEVLSMDWREPRRFHRGSCAFASYSGTFLGIIGPPSETNVSADTFIEPRP